MAIDLNNPQMAELLAKIKSIDWFQFEKLIGLLYEDAGYTVQRKGGAKADGGVDLIVEKPGKAAAIQCKHWNSWKVPPKDIRELIGAMADTGVQHGVCVTMRGFSDDARKLAARQGIVLYTEIDIVEMIIGADSECAPRIAELLNDTRKFCPKCENEMVIRTAKKGKNAGKQFWGCRGYPNCRTVFQIDTETTPAVTEATQPQHAEPTDESLARIKELLKLIMESP